MTVAALTLGMPAGANAHMAASLFMHKADSLRARGPLALFSSDLKLLQTEAESAGDELHAEHRTAASSGVEDYCPPNRKLLGPRELMEGLHAIPANDLARMDIKQAMHAILVRNYPCTSYQRLNKEPVASSARQK